MENTKKSNNNYTEASYDGGFALKNTPLEFVLVGKHRVLVKRDDLCAPFPGPAFGKIRGLSVHLPKLKDLGVTLVGVLSTPISRAGWGVSYVARRLGLCVANFCPDMKNTIIENSPKDYYCEMSSRFGAKQVPLVSSRQSIMYSRAKEWLRKEYGRNENISAVMLTNSLMLEETVEETATEFCNTVPADFCKGTILVAVGSGTICAGIVKALLRRGIVPKTLIGVRVTVGLDIARAKNKILKMAGTTNTKKRKKRFLFDDPEFDMQKSLDVIDGGYGYYKKAKVISPFPCDPWYDRKAWEFLSQHIQELEEPILFWNIG